MPGQDSQRMLSGHPVCAGGLYELVLFSWVFQMVLIAKNNFKISHEPRGYAGESHVLCWVHVTHG